jgi:sugar lactone lactonase YvrE
VDRDGVFWAGTMIEGTALRERAQGALYRLDQGTGARLIIDGVQISNSFCWSPDGAVMYFADTPRRVIWAFDISGDTLANRREFAQTAKAPSRMVPPWMQ